jgi:hypothetical protein
MMLLPVSFQGEELEFEFELQRGYVIRAGVMVAEVVVVFEPDEEGNYRALVTLEDMARSKGLSVGLLQAIGSQLEKLSLS